MPDRCRIAPQRHRGFCIVTWNLRIAFWIQKAWAKDGMLKGSEAAKKPSTKQATEHYSSKTK